MRGAARPGKVLCPRYGKLLYTIEDATSSH